MKHLLNRNKQIKVTSLERSYAHLCWSCSNDMPSKTFIVLIKSQYNFQVRLQYFSCFVGWYLKHDFLSSCCTFSILVFVFTSFSTCKKYWRGGIQTKIDLMQK